MADVSLHLFMKPFSCSKLALCVSLSVTPPRLQTGPRPSGDLEAPTLFEGASRIHTQTQKFTGLITPTRDGII